MPGGRRVADATLDLVTTFPPNNLLPKVVAKRFALALMDDPLLAAYRFPRPTRAERVVARGLLKLRAALIRRMPSRAKPKFARDLGYFRTYPAGYDIEKLGTFPAPVRLPGNPRDRLRSIPPSLAAWRQTSRQLGRTSPRPSSCSRPTA